MNSRGWARSIRTAVAVILLIALPLAPALIISRAPLDLLRLPAESIVATILLSLLPWRSARVVVALLFGVVVASAMLAAGLDAGYEAALDIPFDPTDASQLTDAFGVLRSSIGGAAAVAVLAGLIVVALGVVAAVAWAGLRVGAAVRAVRARGFVVLAAASAVWLAAAAVGAPLAASASLASLDSTAQQAAETQEAVAKLPSEISTDAYAGVPASQLLTALRGKDVVLAFIESYGQVAVQGTSFSSGVDQELQSGQTQLAAEGYSAQSAFLTSPTFGGLSWLAHSTLESGLWIDKQPIYSKVIRSARFTLSDAFRKAGWKTVSDVPSDTQPWPFGTSFYHFGSLLTANNVGYQGPAFGYARIPDQYTWKYFADHELNGPHQPVMAEIDLVSSHTPWASLPKLVPWSKLGNGSVFEAQPAQGNSATEVWQSAQGVQQAYGQSVQYSLGAMFSFLKNVDDPNLVVIALGDHQPATIVSGSGANHDVPISIIAKDPTVFRSIAGWHWQRGVMPSPTAPVWRMDTFRDRFLSAFDQKPQ
ncbi:CDP-alcohol phosphatidyltransferase [Gryllotalpicola reticulitermitis]|uniref:CDP-alcohol phosphatidyltransferase n=1 Tax=Gryllotalpicola reticulitermitis TaxID=1184153 RepID=A0ABV8Q7P9_9MICO